MGHLGRCSLLCWTPLIIIRQQKAIFSKMISEINSALRKNAFYKTVQCFRGNKRDISKCLCRSHPNFRFFILILLTYAFPYIVQDVSKLFSSFDTFITYIPNRYVYTNNFSHDCHFTILRILTCVIIKFLSK